MKLGDSFIVKIHFMDPTTTPTPEPTATPVAMVIYTVVAPGSETGQSVIFRYEMNAGDLLISTLLFGILLMLILERLLALFLRRHK